MTDLFVREPDAPLAERLRPHTLDDVIGQQHLIGEGKPLRVAVEGGKPHSMLLWGRRAWARQRWRGFWRRVSMPSFCLFPPCFPA